MNHIYTDVIQQLKTATDREIGLIDADGNVVADSDPEQIGAKLLKLARVVFLSEDGPIHFSGKTVRALSAFANGFDYAVFVDGEDEMADTLCAMAQVTLNCAKVFYEEKHDKASFVKNIITDNILPGDIYIRAKELHFPADQNYIVYLIRQNGSNDISAVDVLLGLFPDRQQDFVISISETDMALVKAITPETEPSEILELAKTIEDSLKSQLYLKTTIGIGRLIYQLPTTLCEIFLTEVFKKNSIDTLDQETLFTINKFFENNLNVSETSRKLFVHRNTLVYRLEKIKKLTGLDLREFDHAIIFKVALMVKKYLASRDNKMF